MDVSSAPIKMKSTKWIVLAWEALEGKPEVAVNGFKKAGVYDAVIEVTQD